MSEAILDRNRTFKRGQVEFALWRFFSHLRSQSDKPPPVFPTRIKRLLELDLEFYRKNRLKRIPGGRIKAPGFAFVDREPQGQGRDVAFTSFNAFCLGLGLELLDAGFKQSEIVFVMSYIRPQLEEQYEIIRKSPPSISRQEIRHGERPDAPVLEKNGVSFADCTVFMVLRRLELTEIFSQLTGKAAKEPIFTPPEFCRGVEALRVLLTQDMPLHYRKAMVVEIAYSATFIQDALDRTGPASKGRK